MTGKEYESQTICAPGFEIIGVWLTVTKKLSSSEQVPSVSNIQTVCVLVIAPVI